MRRSLVVALLVAGLAAAAGCAHPQNLAPKPGESTTTSRPARTTASSGNNGGDQTEQVCRDAQDVSDDAVADLNDKLGEAQAAANSGNNAAALAAATQAKQVATDWKSELEEFAAKPIDADVKGVLEDGIDTLDELLTTNPQNLNPTQARGDVEAFLDDLEEVCS